MKDDPATIDWIETQKEIMLARVIDWAEINSHSLNLNGLEVMYASLERDFSILQCQTKKIPLSPMTTISPQGQPTSLSLGSCLLLTKRPEAQIQLFFGGHMDTVYPVDSAFQNTEMIDANTLRGPGVTDMKGGLAVMLTALEAFEKSPHAEKVGYRILINSEEEIGSPGSTPYFEEMAEGCQAAFLFEPAFPDRTLASARKGSANYTILVNGQSAHAGRDFFSGKSAVATLSELLVDIHLLNHPEKETTLNLGYVYGGGPVNIVPDLAICRLNVRTATEEDMTTTERQLDDMIQTLARKHSVKCRLVCESKRPPKLFDEKTEKLFKGLKTCAQELGQTLKWHPTGGACDGNTIATMGIPTIDTCGVVGGHIHTPDEFLTVDSLVEKSKWVAHALTKIAKGQL